MNKKKYLNPIIVISAIAVSVLMFKVSGTNYLLYHSIIELFGIIVACGVFMIAFNSKEYMRNNFFNFIGISFLFIASIDFIHMLAYKGMGVFHNSDANTATQLWIGSEYIRAAAFIIAPVLINFKMRMRYLFVTYSFVVIVILLSIFYWRVFPDCFIEGSGLTSFKVSSEYIISLILLFSIFIFYRRRDYFDASIIKLLYASIVFSIISSMSFTLYEDVYGLSNFIGHILKLASYSFIYIAIIHIGLRKPYDLLFRDLKQNETKLLNALTEIKTLSGILPICASCKKIRNDKGYWQMVEEYISEHSDAKFSHGICMDCAKKMYPGVFNENDVRKKIY